MPASIPRDERYALHGQAAIITGSSAGIGLATAHRLSRLGAAVVLNGRDRKPLDHAVAGLPDGAVSAVVLGDAADPGVVADLVATAGGLGHLHIAVANVGGGSVGVKLADLDADTLADSYRHNVAGTAELIRHAAPIMAAQRYGRIVTVASLAGRRFGRVSGPDYSAHKAAVVGLTRHTAAELGGSGVTVNCVAPGVIDTGRARGMVAALGDGAEERILGNTPVGRWGTPAEVAAAICFLASPEASYITGHTLDVNGGAFMN